jgi:hypothetical protein
MGILVRYLEETLGTQMSLAHFDDLSISNKKMHCSLCVGVFSKAKQTASHYPGI